MDIRSNLMDDCKVEDLMLMITRLIPTIKEQLEKTISDAVQKALGANIPKIEESVWLSPAQVCNRLDIDRSTLWRWSKEGYLPGTKFGNRTRYKLSDVERVEGAEK